MRSGCGISAPLAVPRAPAEGALAALAVLACLALQGCDGNEKQEPKPPPSSPPRYDPAEARRFASVSSATYCDDVGSLENWTCGPCRDSRMAMAAGRVQVLDVGVDNAMRVIVGKLKDQGCIMAFRGSDDYMNWYRDAQFFQGQTAFKDCKDCMVHTGFYTILQNVLGDMLNASKAVGCAPTEKFYLTGHSLGGALAHLAMFHLKQAGYNVAQGYSFEAPRVGNKAFSDKFNSLFGRKFPVVRITYNRDPLVRAPPQSFKYTHVQTEVHYVANGTYKICPEVEDPSCSDGNSLLVPYFSDHCASPLVPNRNICFPKCASPAELVV